MAGTRLPDNFPTTPSATKLVVEQRDDGHHSYHFATMEEQDQHLKKYNECEELYKQAKYTEYVMLARSNLTGTRISS
jgi:hypothetical protein